jgi:L-alanine-DL-glutamate epimerase-like enolase superfamily enzyme
MQIGAIEACSLSIPFKLAFKHASAERASTQSLLVRIRSAENVTGVGEGCPREYVTAESLESALAFVERHRADWISEVHDVQSMRRWVEHHASEIDANLSAWAAAEIALLDCLGKAANVPIEELLGVPNLAGTFSYTAVLGDSSIEAFERQLARYVAAGFTQFKIKLSRDADANRAKVRAVAAANIPSERVRADANNAWTSAQEAFEHLSSLNYRFAAIEEPLQPGDFVGMRRLSSALDARIILDESARAKEHIEALATDPERWIVNVRIAKMGGIVRSLDVVRVAKLVGVPIIVGAHVGETSVLTRAALTVANFGRDILLAQEGAFGTNLLEHDIADPPLMFGAGGMLDASKLDAPGLGLGTLQCVGYE